jgi:hypothetical protein
MEQDDITFQRKIKEADALLCLLDGQKVCSLMRGERLGLVWSINDLHNMLIIMQRVDKPIHFVISKWDIVKEQYTLEQILKRLIQIEEFKSIVELRNQANSPVRLIPVSSVGMGFAKLQPDGSMKKTGILPKPYQVEIPLAYVLPDRIKAKLEELIKIKEEEKNKSIEVKTNLSFWDRLRKYAGIVGKTVVATVKDILPRKYQFADEILKEIINVIDDIERPIHEKEALAKKRLEELKLKKAESIKAVESEETALKHVVNCFLSIVNQLEINYPQSNIKL